MTREVSVYNATDEPDEVIGGSVLEKVATTDSLLGLVNVTVFVTLRVWSESVDL